MESRECRFAHLLQPIRELTKNWEIDVASELNDYLEELDQMCITFDDGKTRLNFAEAALLIQGTACIYSKKVELLHSLVYQTLEFVNEKNKKQGKAASEAQEKSNDAEPGDDDYQDDFSEFVPIEIEVMQKNRKEDSNTISTVAPLPPKSMIPSETHEKQKRPLISDKGEVSCSIVDFRMNSFIPGDNDMILILAQGSSALGFLHHGPAEPLHQQQHEDVAAEAADPARADETLADAGADGGGAASGFFPLDDMEVEVEENVDRHQAPSDGRMIRERRQLEDDKVKRKETPPPVDLWELQDPYSVIGQNEPFKSGKCYKIPDGLDDGKKRKRRRVALQEFESWFRSAHDPQLKLKNGPSLADLNYIYLSHLGNKLAARSRMFRRKGVRVSEEELKKTILEEEGGELDQQGVWPDLQGAGPDLQGAEPGGDDDSSDNEHEEFPNDIPAEFGGGAEYISPDKINDEMSYEDLVKLRVEQLVTVSQGYIQETALSQRVKEWEKKIKPLLQQQEERPAFDIHDYSDRIVEELKVVGQQQSFASIVSGLDNVEASKYMLAALQLANDGTVEVDSVGVLEEGMDTMSLALLSTERATERFKNMMANS